MPAGFPLDPQLVAISYPSPNLSPKTFQIKALPPFLICLEEAIKMVDGHVPIATDQDALACFMKKPNSYLSAPPGPETFQTDVNLSYTRHSVGASAWETARG
jgi:hypothetical protein